MGNPMAHYEQTAEEIIDALDGKVDYVVCPILLCYLHYILRQSFSVH